MLTKKVVILHTERHTGRFFDKLGSCLLAPTSFLTDKKQWIILFSQEVKLVVMDIGADGPKHRSQVQQQDT